MILTSQYGIGQRVVHIFRTHDMVGMPCPVCKGEGQLALLGGGFVPCTQQYSGLHCTRGLVRTRVVYRWTPRPQWLTIGRVEITVGGVRDTRESVQYMCDETGVGSGSVYYEPDLFATLEEAQAECAARDMGEDHTVITDAVLADAYAQDDRFNAERAEDAG